MPQKVKEHVEDLIAVIMISDMTHSENSEAQGGQHFYFYPVYIVGGKTVNKPTQTSATLVIVIAVEMH